MITPAQIKALIIVALVAATFTSGWWVNGWRWEAKLADAAEKADTARQVLANKNSELIKKESKVEQKIIYKTRTVYKTVARIAGPAICIDDERVRFRANWNEAARQTGKPDDTVR